ncbi:MAG TPA: DUF6647 family protein [Burkholderiales bacterium]|nr:DUF6647 family protein [Burkholderiales bacterium]
MPPDLLAYLLAAAVRLSGYPAIGPEELPPVLRLPPAELAAQACPHRREDCRSVAAVFEPGQYVIYLRDNLNLEDPADNSFLLHELVHVLQWKRDGEAMYEGCERSMETEREAYRVQNAYLKQEGRLARFGHALLFLSCSGEQGALFSRDVMAAPPSAM